MFLFFRQTTQNGLVKNGTNVCKKTVSFQQSFSSAYDSLQIYTYYTSCGFLWASYCARYRYYYTTHYRTTYGISYRKEQQCCKGWSQVGDQCTKGK
ncbi:multiple epidermal growth factor-like domains protein 11 [Actinia tenebrosa]|uniref:Multiple epidermal growth factor-like domains protein 11 n=1 Tax=Actinia tenebrosa TaxID=6105 RepID=A0A6P8IAT2_ACTTE|nr:multiple epidermal growth factor-like domains protein 11 [Actinia tenebrosa]